MNKVYNTQKDIASGFANFFQKIMPNMRKTQLKIIPFILHGMIVSESLVPLDIAKVLKDDFSLIQIESIIKRIKRLFINKYFNPYDFYDEIIKHVIANYKKKHNDKRVHIIFDHMFSKDNYTIFMITMRVGKQGILFGLGVLRAMTALMPLKKILLNLALVMFLIFLMVILI